MDPYLMIRSDDRQGLLDLCKRLRSYQDAAEPRYEDFLIKSATFPKDHAWLCSLCPRLKDGSMKKVIGNGAAIQCTNVHTHVIIYHPSWKMEVKTTKAYACSKLGFLGGGTVGGRTYTERECYETALTHDATYADAWCGLGAVGGGTVGGRTYTKKKCYETALAHDATYLNAWYNLGVVGGGAVGGRTYTKKECYETALTHDATYALAWNGLGAVGGGTVG